MKKFLTAGVLVVIIPLVGIPIFWKTWILVLLGLYIIWQTFVYKKNDIQPEKKDSFDKVYIENGENIEE
ncbi:MAG: hypothetical protein KAS02_00625 [Candidatus Pacebacteria bacterium]|nr:hypothetical protein [Candidatus Paceibacterota bacterium]